MAGLRGPTGTIVSPAALERSALAAEGELSAFDEQVLAEEETKIPRQIARPAVDPLENVEGLPPFARRLTPSEEMGVAAGPASAAIPPPDPDVAAPQPGSDVPMPRVQAPRLGTPGLGRAGRAVEGEVETAQTMRQAALAASARERQEQLAEYEADLRTFQDERRLVLQEKQDELNGYLQAYQSVSTAPNLALTRKETTAGVVATIVSGLGAMAATISGGQQNLLAPMANQILQRARNAVERDIKQRMRRADRLKIAVDATDRQIQRMRQLFDDDEAALKALSAVEMERAVLPHLRNAEAAGDLAKAGAAKMSRMMAEAELKNDQMKVNAALLNTANQQAVQALANQRRQRDFATKNVVFDPEAKVPGDQQRNIREKITNLGTVEKLGKRAADIVRQLEAEGLQGIIARSGAKTMASVLAGTKAAKLGQELDSIAKRLFAATSNFGAALSEREILFGEARVGSPQSVWVSSDTFVNTLRGFQQQLQQEVQSDIDNTQGAILTERGRGAIGVGGQRQQGVPPRGAKRARRRGR